MKFCDVIEKLEKLGEKREIRVGRFVSKTIKIHVTSIKEKFLESNEYTSSWCK